MTRKPPTTNDQSLPGDTGRPCYMAGAAISFLVALVLYVKTMAASASFWDAGEFIAASYTLGIPHSPGTPLFILLGRVFTLLPLPLATAAKVNFISALFGALGVLFLYILTVRYLDSILGASVSLADTLSKVAGALVGAMFIAFSSTYWTNATEAEVYALSVFFMSFMTWLALKWADNPGGSKSTSFIYLLFYLLALSVGFHLGTILAFAGIFPLVLMTKNKTFTNTQFLLACFGMAIFVADATLYRNGVLTLVLLGAFSLALLYVYSSSRSVFAAVCTGLFFLGISVHLYLRIRSAHNPLIDEADPETWRNLYAVLRREQYPPTNLFVRKAAFGFQLQHFNGYFQQQFAMASGYLGKMSFGSLVPLALGIWGMVDHYAKNRKTFVMLFATFLVVSLGMIIYLNFSATEVRERDYFYSPAFYYFAVFIGIGAGSVLSEFKRWAVRSRVRAATAVSVPALALLVMPFFTAKHHYFTHDRSRNYVCREYAMNMLTSLEPNSVLFTNGDNDTFPLWYIQEVEKFRTDVRVVNLSLLNTPWYLRQLRDNEPRLEIQWTDEQLSRLRPIRTRDGWVLVRDLGIQHIVQNVSGHRPIYFAVTIPPEYFAPYRDIMEMEGLAYRVVPRKGRNMVNIEKLEDSIWKKFSYHGVLDENWKRDQSIYKQPFVDRLVQNYGAAFTQLGFVRAQENRYAEAVKNLEVAQEISPDLSPISTWLGWYYVEMGDTARGLQYYDEQLARRPDRVELLYRKAAIYERIGDLQGAYESLTRLIRSDPEHRDAVISVVKILASRNESAQALDYLDHWLARHPNDAVMRKARDDIRNGRAGRPDSADGE